MSRRPQTLLGCLRSFRYPSRLLNTVLSLGVMLGFTACSDSSGTSPTHDAPADQSTIAITLSDSTAAVGSIVTVSIDARRGVADSASNFPVLAAFRSRLAFSSAQLQYVDEAPDNIGMQAINVVGDTARLVGIAPGTGFSDGRLVTLRFRVLDPQGLRSFRVTLDELHDLRYQDRRAEFLGAHVALRRPAADVVPPTSATRLYGDATADGVIDAADALAILTTDVGMAPPPGFDSAAADVNMDNTVNALDAQIILASLVGRDVLQFRLGDVVGAPQVSVTAVSPDTLRPGMPATITGINFTDVVANDTVLIDSVPAVVTAATPTQLTITVPSMRCRATHGAVVVVRTGGSKGSWHQMLRVATPHTMQLGDTLVFDRDDAFRCNEFLPGQYFVAVYNTAREASPVLDTFQLVSAQAQTLAGGSVSQNRAPAGLVRTLVPPPPMQPLHWDLIPGGTRARQHAIAHLQFMARDQLRAQHAKYGPSRQAWTDGVRLRPRFDINSSLGGFSTVSFLGVTQDGSDTVITIHARTVYVGTHSQILEDELAPLAQQMDSYYQQLGTEFDNVMYPILTTNFGNPLAMDGNLSHLGRVTMLFTPSVAKYYPGTEAFVTVCDFLTLADCPASNLTEMFYADLPTQMTTSDGSNPAYDTRTPAGWYNEIRGTLIHETKHITALAEKFSRSTTPVLEESWLEEGTAQIASELYARSISNSTWKGNAGFSNAIRCEIYLCQGYTFTMLDHFAWLYDYESNANRLSPIDPGWYDGTIYGSAWLLTRWATDAYAYDEASFLRSLVQQTSVNGVSNLEARTGKSWNKMLGQWALALAADHYSTSFHTPGFSSWNTRSVFSGMSQTLKGFPAAYPLTIPSCSGATISVTGVVARGSAAFYNLTFDATQSVGIQANAMTDLPGTTTLRMAIVRVQ